LLNRGFDVHAQEYKQLWLRISTQLVLHRNSVQATSEAPATVVPPKSATAIKAALKDCAATKTTLRDAARRAYKEGRKMDAFGRVIVVAMLTGELCLFENLGAPQWS
jgi:hypothetical protein